MRTCLVLTALLALATSCTKTIHEARGPQPAQTSVSVADARPVR